MASKILIAEDDANILGLLSVFLSGLGYEVSLARDGQEALEMAVQIKPDLVIVDIMMPRMNGFKLVNTLAMDRHDIPMPKVIMLTSLADKENVQRGLSVGADVYIPKPFNLEDVAARVSELLGETPAK
jgi:DNA-binding response OmpR family regulator